MKVPGRVCVFHFPLETKKVLTATSPCQAVSVWLVRLTSIHRDPSVTGGATLAGMTVGGNGVGGGGVSDGGAVLVAVAVAVNVKVGEGVKVSVGVAVGVSVGVLVAVGVKVFVGVAVAVLVTVKVGVKVSDALAMLADCARALIEDWLAWVILTMRKPMTKHTEIKAANEMSPI